MKVGDKVSFTAPMGLTNTGTVLAVENDADGKPVNAAVAVEVPITCYPVSDLQIVTPPAEN